MRSWTAATLTSLLLLGCSGTTTDSGLRAANAAGASGAGSGAGRGGAGASASGGAGRGGASGGGGQGGSGGSGPRSDAGAVDAGPRADAGGQAGSDAGATNDAGMAGSDAGPGCASAGYALCEDFESTELGAVPSGWMKRGAVEVASDQVHGGTRALKVGAAATGQRRITRSLDSLGTTSGTHWGRVYYRVKPQPTPTDRVIHATFVALHGESPNHDDTIEVRVVDTVANVTGKHQFLFNVEPDGDRGEFGDGYSYDWTLDGDWHCAEWRVAFGDQSYQFFIDGDEVTEIAQHNGAGNFDGTELAERFETVAVGINNYQDAAFGGSEGYEMWLDDFAIDADRIGCQ